jgi:hypothetical protein
MTFGFIVTRHVTNEQTNRYWNLCVQSIRKFYPVKKIVIIDDNSDKTFIKNDYEYENVFYINSIYPKRGELLPYIYLLKHEFFPCAVILHDSSFFQRRINFEKLKGTCVLPLWHFSYRENITHCIKLATHLENAHLVKDKMDFNPVEYFGFRSGDKWYGCFGVQSYISLGFLQQIQAKYRLTNLLPVILTREDRCCLERIMGAIFYKESPALYNTPSLLGNIWTYQEWGYSYQQYMKNNKYARLPLVKVWTGR